jgi:Holliday junction resolvase RusA-like endonuclease
MSPTSIFLPGHPPTANQLQRMHYIDRGLSRNSWSKSVWIASLEAGWKDAKLTPVRLHIEFVYTVERRRDFDNMVAGLKGAIDGLVVAGVIPDDSIDHLRGIDLSVKVDRKAAPGINLWVERLEAAATP